MSREATTKLLEMVDDGIMEPLGVLRECLAYMSEDDVRDMCQSADWFDIEEDEEDEDDGDAA